ncbi:PREDICTED: uncharacterized protein LOC109148849 isoform X3 [Ipomoea nil]|uniref:uncharacterized protein LOC109148849 isoform X3 n=1 Tax=Ipomoea nil TaxID=35883 RepID=UPI00090150B6|nr:PREDICTED: uncharacterized protein LOC109148849 isoform X3 [Ipomoea nil]
MDEYLQCMKTLRSQMNDVEDQATKISVEEQMQLTTLQTLEADLNSVKRQTIQLKEDIDKMVKAKGEICSLILEKRRKFSSLEGNSSTLYQTLELSQQERTNLSTKLLEKRKYYSKVAEDITTHLKEQQHWIDDHKCGSFIGVNSQAMDTIFKKTGETEVYQDNAVESLSKNFEAANTKLSQLKQLKFELDLENTKPELREMDVKFLEDEHQALSGDKVELTEYVQSLQFQIVKLKGISHTINCCCGEEYKIEMDCSAR